MTILQALILGIVQGLTEFLPISSSAHLVLTPHFLGWDLPTEEAFVFNVLVQVGTLVAVIVYFWKDLLDIAQAVVQGLFKRQPFLSAESRLGWYIILATLPAGLAGLWLKNSVEAAFNSVPATAFFLLGTAGLLVAGEYLGKRQRSLEKLGWTDALVMGIFQALAIFPGISRSGSTISGGMLCGLDRQAAARFSFLMSIPIMLAAGLLSILDLSTIPNASQFVPALAAGFITSAAVGYLSIRWLLAYLNRHSFYAFAIYVSLLAAAALVWNQVF